MKTEKKKLPSFPGCFVCGKENQRGLKLSFSAVDDKVMAIFKPDQSLLGYGHAVHGGIVSSVLDDAIVWAAYAATGRFGVTAELNIRFLKPVNINQEYRIEGVFLENKGKIWTAEGYIRDSEGNIRARGSGKIFPLTNRQLKEMHHIQSESDNS